MFRRLRAGLLGSDRLGRSLSSRSHSGGSRTPCVPARLTSGSRLQSSVQEPRVAGPSGDAIASPHAKLQPVSASTSPGRPCPWKAGPGAPRPTGHGSGPPGP